MKRLYKSIVSLVFMALVAAGFGAGTAFAQFTILPQSKDPASCENLLKSNTEEQIAKMLKTDGRDEALACAIITGRISLNMIPYFISYFANFLLSLVSLISMLFIVIGGYYYIYGGLVENKEKGKKTVYHALLGMAVAILSWVIINVIISAVTS